MSEARLLGGVLWAMVAVAVAVAVRLLVAPAPYGRHAGATRGPSLDARLGWVVMESPAAIVFAAALLSAGRPDAARLAFLLLWEAHYLHRAFVFPFRLRPGARMPLLVAGAGFVFCAVNGWVNGRWLGALAPDYGGARWLADPRFLVGAALFVGGAAVNLHADAVLLALRRPGERGYRVPRGGLYRYVSCPNYLGELVEWCGFALATWSPAAAVFALWTAANLVPRALAHHRWYRATFPDYPPERRALVPFVL